MKITGKARWAKVFEPSDLSGKYEVDITHISDADAAKLSAAGIEVKADEDSGNWVKAKADSSYKPKIVTKANKDWPDSTLIGNGSLCYFLVNPFEWTFKGKTGMSLGLNGVQVLEHVAYGGTFNDETASEESFGSVEIDD